MASSTVMGGRVALRSMLRQLKLGFSQVFITFSLSMLLLLI
jgi:hypothetical protein